LGSSSIFATFAYPARVMRDVVSGARRREVPGRSRRRLRTLDRAAGRVNEENRTRRPAGGYGPPLLTVGRGGEDPTQPATEQPRRVHSSIWSFEPLRASSAWP